MNEKLEIQVGNKTIYLGDLTVAALAEVMTAFMQDFEFSKEAAVKKIIELTQLNKEVSVDDEDLYYIAGEIDDIFGSYMLDVAEEVDDDVIEYTVTKQDGEKSIVILRKPNYKTIRELDEYMRKQTGDDIPVDVFGFIRGQITKNLVETIYLADGTAVNSDMTVITDVRLAVPIAIRYLTHVRRKQTTVKKKY